MGLTNENSVYGTVRNPWDPRRIAGGSSGGSAAAVAAGMCFVAVGADAAGSIRVPSAICGGVGMKASFGLVPTHGDFPLARSLGHVGPMTRSVADAAAALDVLAGGTTLGATVETPLDHLTIGINESYYFDAIDSRIERVVRDMLEILRGRGATITSVALPALQEAQWATAAILHAEAAAIHHDNLQSRPNDFAPDVREKLQVGEKITAVEYLQAMTVRETLNDDFTAAFSHVDVMISPTMPVLAPLVGTQLVELNGQDVPLAAHFNRLCVPTSLTGHPSLTVPAGLVNGLPVGMQIIGEYSHEATVFQVGRLVEGLVEDEGLLSGSHPSWSRAWPN